MTCICLRFKIKLLNGWLPKWLHWHCTVTLNRGYGIHAVHAAPHLSTAYDLVVLCRTRRAPSTRYRAPIVCLWSFPASLIIKAIISEQDGEAQWRQANGRKVLRRATGKEHCIRGTQKRCRPASLQRWQERTSQKVAGRVRMLAMILATTLCTRHLAFLWAEENEV